VQQTLAEILDATIGPYADAESRAHVLNTMTAATPDLMDASVRAIEAWDRERVDHVFASLRPDLPMLAIQSTYHDRFVARHGLNRETDTTPYLDFIRNAHKRIDIRILPDTGHFSMLERPDEVTALIRGFGIAALSPDKPRS
jgi:pimeloyl-ACP methyl ester carboxylesterase